MGIIDQKNTLLTCLDCQITETLTAVEKGSLYGSSGWGKFNNSKCFDVASQDIDHFGPTITTAKCTQCGCDATINNS